MGVRCILWEEFHLTPDNVEDCKKIFGGQKHVVNAKYKSGVEVPSTPCFLTSNKSLAKLAPMNSYGALKERMIIFTFPKSMSANKDFEFEWPITKEDWLWFLTSNEDVLNMFANGKAKWHWPEDA